MTAMMPTELQAARLCVLRDHPYLASAVCALTTVERPGLGTLAVDQWWRLYFDSAVCQRWTVPELAAVLYHEVGHLMREHHARMAAVGAERDAANVATDAEINDDLREEGAPLPNGAIYPEQLGQQPNLLAEQYLEALTRTRRPATEGASEQGRSAQPESSDEGDSDDGSAASPAAPRQEDGGRDGQAATPGGAEAARATDGAVGTSGRSAAAAAAASSSTAASGGQADAARSAGQGDAATATSGTASESISPAASDSSAASSQTPTSPVGNGRAGGTEAGPAEARTPPGWRAPAPAAGACGSCAHGGSEPWEDGPPGAPGGAPGLGRAEAELVRRDVARRIQECGSQRGTVPGQWRRWADEHARPRTDWRRVLAAELRRAVADVAGAADYSYRRPSRRAGVAPGVVLPALRQPVPSVAVVVDTSGSMSDDTIARARAEIAGILRAAGQRDGVRVLAVDSAVQSSRRVQRASQVALHGGGGTDMRVGIDAALRLRPRPRVIVVVSDCLTPWPESAPRGARVIVARAAGGGSAPGWARVVEVD